MILHFDQKHHPIFATKKKTIIYFLLNLIYLFKEVDFSFHL